uniref:M23 family metallopeptidase n=1 Tax=Fundidesulfovibrio putealis TaxID=270496 RepID=A0A7C4ELS6_9BACT
MLEDLGEFLGEGGLELAQTMQLDDLLPDALEMDQQDLFTTGVHDFLNAGQPDTGHDGGWQSLEGPPPWGFDRQGEPAPVDPDMARGLHAFARAGQQGEGGTGGLRRVAGNEVRVPINPAGADGPSTAPGRPGNAVIIRLTAEDIRQFTSPPGNSAGYGAYDDPAPPADAGQGYPAPEAGAQPGAQDPAGGGADQPYSPNWEEIERQRRIWEQEKGIDPETKREYGIFLPGDGKITSPFGWRDSPTGRRNPDGTLKREMHYGIDIRNPLGGDVRASQAGTVIAAGPGSDGANRVIIETRHGQHGMYVHTAPSVKAGDNVYGGDVLGTTDMSGRTTGPHIHFGIKDPRTGEYSNPENILFRR